MSATLKRSLLVIALVSTLASCAVVPPNSGDNPNDPWETFNRQTHAFNMTMDEYVLHPIAVGYSEYVPTPVQEGVDNFFSNLGEPGNMLNNFLQGKFKEGAVSLARFLINSTIGIAGLFDVASHMSLEYSPEDFGETLGSWGVGPGPYVVWPFLGPSTVRDTVGIPVDWATYPPTYYFWGEGDKTGYAIGLAALDAVNTRAKLLSTDAMLQTALDPYVAVREAYLQNRENQVWDGNPPLTLMNDEFEDEEYDQQQ